VGQLARAGLDHGIDAAGSELLRHIWHERHALLALGGLVGYSKLHRGGGRIIERL
jgi:hypothetical protein